MNTKVPSYSLKTISGKKYKSNKQNGKIIVFTFMYLNSDASRKQIPQLNKLKDTFKNKDVEFIAAFLDPEYKIKKFLKTFPFNYEITDDASWLAKKFDVDLFPTNVIIDAKGKYQYYKTSYKSDMFESLSFSVEKLLNDE
ncbi:TlpA disulfide reductase family protein [Polaribacter undariae]|uniref:TlpA disulfide reductase family protein n=1 Tax=Polaribacter sejongensis TaxID=985043 RepID=A0AAJ1QYC1_9FLAO|nr:TlpA disulfide reductase family protein [Polaribacter undariae]MDN3620392.1 TlpA disulfide reductase family protein [Polaribacter undariae]UWD33816.1 TlpA family protein disulfide reductase [Polaribacter undariae]